MPITAATEFGGTYRKIFTLISSATTDTGPITIAHGFGSSVGIKTGSDATNFLNLSFIPIIGAGAPGMIGWFVSTVDQTNIVVDRVANTISTASASAQVRLMAQVMHSIQR